MLSYWCFNGDDLLKIECPLEGFEKEWEETESLLKAINNQGYFHQTDIVSHSSWENSKMHETTREDRYYRFLIELNPGLGDNFDFVFIRNLPEYLLYLKFMMSIHGAELKDES
jgi:hypothetical protein